MPRKSKNTKHARTTKPAKGAKSPKRAPRAKAQAATSSRVSALDAAAQVLAETGSPMRAKDLIEQMAAKGLWSSPAGKTPEATLSAAIGREIKAAGTGARFVRAGRGMFGAAHTPEGRR